MTQKKSVLDRGLQALLGGNTTVNAAASTQVAEHLMNVSTTTVQEVPVELLHRAPYQPRRHFEPQALMELAESIRAQGILQPLIVRKLAGQTGFEIIAGERRWRAAQQAELATVPAIIREVDDKTAQALALIENVQRQDLLPVDEAMALQKLITEHGLNHQDLAELVGKSRTTITNLLRLLNLEAEVQQLLNEKHLEMGHAKVLLALSGQQQKQAAKMVKEQQLSVRATEQLVKRLMRGPKLVAVTRIDPDIERLQQKISATLGAPVIFKSLGKGKGELIIKYHSLDELTGILEHIK